MRQRATRFMRRTMYRLKRRFGAPVTFHRVDDSGLNPKTGAKNPVVTTLDLQNVVVLPAVMEPKFVYDLSVIGANRDFTMGGHFNRSQRKLLVDTQSHEGHTGNTILTFDPQVGDYFTYGGRRWEIRQVHEFEIATVFLILGEETQGVKANQYISPRAESWPLFTQSAEQTP